MPASARRGRRPRRGRCAPGAASSSSTRSRIPRSCSAGVRPSGAARAEPGRHLVLQAGHPDLEELVEVLAEDGEELGPLEQRARRVVGQGEDPGVEVEPGQLAVEEATVVGSPRRRAATGGRHRLVDGALDGTVAVVSRRAVRPADGSGASAGEAGVRRSTPPRGGRGPTRAGGSPARRRGRPARGCGGTAGRGAGAARAGPSTRWRNSSMTCGRRSRTGPPSAGRPGPGTRLGRGPGAAAAARGWSSTRRRPYLPPKRSPACSRLRRWRCLHRSRTPGVTDFKISGNHLGHRSVNSGNGRAGLRRSGWPRESAGRNLLRASSPAMAWASMWRAGSAPRAPCRSPASNTPWRTGSTTECGAAPRSASAGGSSSVAASRRRASPPPAPSRSVSARRSMDRSIAHRTVLFSPG